MVLIAEPLCDLLRAPRTLLRNDSGKHLRLLVELGTRSQSITLLIRVPISQNQLLMSENVDPKPDFSRMDLATMGTDPIVFHSRMPTTLAGTELRDASSQVYKRKIAKRQSALVPFEIRQ